MSNFLTFIAHGERPLLQFHDIYDDPDYDEDENKYFKIDKSDTNFYLTFSDIGQPLYQLPINIIHYGLSGLKSREILRSKLEEISKMPSGTGLKYASLQILLKGILINGCIKNLFLLAKNKNKIVEDDLSPYQDWSNIQENNFSDISFNFVDMSPIFNNQEINEYYKSISSFYNIDTFLDMIFYYGDTNLMEPIFTTLIFNSTLGKEEAMLLLYIYKFIISIICSMMGKASRSINDKLFFSILKFYPSDEIFINYTIDSINKNIFTLPIFDKLLELIQQDFIIPQNLSLKLYYKEKPIPNYNYFVNGYFNDTSKIIVKIGLRKFTDYYNLINNYMYNLTTDTNEHYKKIIESLSTRCFTTEYFETDKNGRTLRDFSSIIDDNDANKYLDDNYKFMINGSIYPEEVTNIDFVTTKFIDESGEKKLKFIKGNIRSLKELINQEKIFDTNNIVLLFSCAVDLESYDKEHHTIPRTRSESIDWQNEKKYLKYKNKYLQFKKKLGL
jgi:hypothetical protein